MLTEMESILEFQRETIVGACEFAIFMVKDQTKREALLGQVNNLITTMNIVKNALENIDEYLRLQRIIYGNG